MNASIQPSQDFVEFRREDVDTSIAARFERQVERYPDRVAVKIGMSEVTYLALNAGANCVAHWLLTERSPRTERVAVLCERGAAMIEAGLGILKAGKVWVPLDATYPWRRNNFILDHSEATILLTDDRHAEAAHNLASRNCSVVEIGQFARLNEKGNPGVQIAPDAIACLLYTSGSTGVPKGVVHSHRTLLHLIMRYTNALFIRSSDRVSLLSSCSHMAGVSALLRGLLNGATVLPLDPRDRGPTELADWISREAITVWHLGPSLFRHVVRDFKGDENFPQLRLIHLGGEPVAKSDVELFRGHFPPSCLLLNNLGCTEISSFRQYLMDHETDVIGGTVPVGHSVEDTEVLLLDDSGNEVPLGEMGEIAVKSRYLALGYWREPGLTKASFEDVAGQNGWRVYRTGDLGRMLPGDCLTYLGRRDFQVEIRGYRVELAEVEKALLDSGELQACTVIGKEDPAGETQLIAYLVARQQPSCGAIRLRTLLQAELPPYMVPAAFVWLDALPRLPNGKLDRQALPPPDWSRAALAQVFVAPRTAVEKAIAAIWEEVLGVEHIGIHDDFLALGAHSLHLARALSRIRRSLRLDLPLESLYESSTVAGVAILIEQIRRQADPAIALAIHEVNS
jgi:amino acid adenylation domain-containing protein